MDPLAKEENKVKKKHRILVILSFICMMAATVTLNLSDVQAASLKLNKKTISLNKGSSYQLKTNSRKKVKWSSTKKSVATVSSRGKVTAKKNGTAYIKSKVGSKTLTCKVKVFTAKMTPAKLSVNTNCSAALKVKGAKVSKWSSSNTKLVTVSKKGVVKAKSRTGTCSVYAYVGNSKLTCKVTVNDNMVSQPGPLPPITPVKEMTNTNSLGFAYYKGNKIRSYEELGAAFMDIHPPVREFVRNYIHAGMTEVEKIGAIRQFFVDRHTYYSYGNFGGLNHALYSQNSYCEDMSEATFMLAAACGLECGIESNDMIKHQYNIVRINGKWYELDNTPRRNSVESAMKYPSTGITLYGLGESVYINGEPSKEYLSIMLYVPGSETVLNMSSAIKDSVLKDSGSESVSFSTKGGKLEIMLSSALALGYDKDTSLRLYGSSPTPDDVLVLNSYGYR